MCAFKAVIHDGKGPAEALREGRQELADCVDWQSPEFAALDYFWRPWANARAGLLPDDEQIARDLRHRGKQVLAGEWLLHQRRIAVRRRQMFATLYDRFS